MLAVKMWRFNSPTMTNEIKNNWNEFKKSCYIGKEDDKKIQAWLSSSLKALLESLDKELEIKKKYPYDGNGDGDNINCGFNEGLNLAQEKLRELIN